MERGPGAPLRRLAHGGTAPGISVGLGGVGLHGLGIRRSDWAFRRVRLQGRKGIEQGRVDGRIQLRKRACGRSFEGLARQRRRGRHFGRGLCGRSLAGGRALRFGPPLQGARIEAACRGVRISGAPGGQLAEPVPDLPSLVPFVGVLEGGGGGFQQGDRFGSPTELQGQVGPSLGVVALHGVQAHGPAMGFEGGFDPTVGGQQGGGGVQRFERFGRVSAFEQRLGVPQERPGPRIGVFRKIPRCLRLPRIFRRIVGPDRFGTRCAARPSRGWCFLFERFSFGFHRGLGGIFGPGVQREAAGEGGAFGGVCLVDTQGLRGCGELLDPAPVLPSVQVLGRVLSQSLHRLRLALLRRAARFRKGLEGPMARTDRSARRVRRGLWRVLGPAFDPAGQIVQVRRELEKVVAAHPQRVAGAAHRIAGPGPAHEEDRKGRGSLTDPLDHARRILRPGRHQQPGCFRTLQPEVELLDAGKNVGREADASEGLFEPFHGPILVDDEDGLRQNGAPIAPASRPGQSTEPRSSQ